MLQRRALLSGWWSVSGKPDFEPHAVAADLQGLATQDLVLDEDYLTAVTVDQVGSATTPTRLQLLALRSYDNRPLQYSPGQQVAAVSLPTGYFAADVTHVVLWPDGTAAQDFHANAPRLGRLAYYLRRKVSSYVIFESLYDPRVVQQLQDIRGRLRTVEISMTSPERARQDRGAFGALIPGAFGEKAPSLSVRLGMGRHGSRDRFLAEDVEESALQIAEQASELVDNLVISGRSKSTNRSVRLNLLKERLGEDLLLQRAAVDSSLPQAGHAYAELERVYRDLQATGALEEAVRAAAMRG